MRKGYIGLLGAMAMMGNVGLYDDDKNSLTPSRIDVQPKRKIIPNGAKQYFFDKDGHWDNGEESSVLTDNRVFDCIARTDAKAVDKFKKWKLVK